MWRTVEYKTPSGGSSSSSGFAKRKSQHTTAAQSGSNEGASSSNGETATTTAAQIAEQHQQRVSFLCNKLGKLQRQHEPTSALAQQVAGSVHTWLASLTRTVSKYPSFPLEEVRVHLVAMGVGSLSAACCSGEASHHQIDQVPLLQAAFFLRLRREVGEALSSSDEQLPNGNKIVVASAHCFDPVSTSVDDEVWKNNNVSPMTQNTFGAFDLMRQQFSVFNDNNICGGGGDHRSSSTALDVLVAFYPHCGKAMYHNLLASNWGPSSSSSRAVRTAAAAVEGNNEARGEQEEEKRPAPPSLQFPLLPLHRVFVIGNNVCNYLDLYVEGAKKRRLCTALNALLPLLRVEPWADFAGGGGGSSQKKKKKKGSSSNSCNDPQSSAMQLSFADTACFYLPHAAAAQNAGADEDVRSACEDVILRRVQNVSIITDAQDML